MNIVNSPVTGTNNVQLLNTYGNSITSYSILLEKSVDNYLCKDSGLIFNASGARGKENDFYSDLYDLHSESVYSEFKYETEGSLLGIYDSIIEFIASKNLLGPVGSMLDIGCGKGLLLNKFQKRMLQWELFAIEPSKNAIRYFEKVMPSLKVFNGNFEEAPFLSSQFDLVTANGVLEHVPDPVAFMNLFRNCMCDDGIGFIGVPNFLNNPIDLTTYDHLSRFTPETIAIIFAKSGLEIVHQFAPDNRVPMWFIIRKQKYGQTKEIHAANINMQIELFQKSENYINDTFAAYQRCLDNLKNDEKIAMYGTGAIALIATMYTSLSFDRISCFLDDNDSLWGTTKYNIPVKSPAAINADNINYVLISANPCYHSQILSKLKTLQVKEKNIFF